MQIETSGFLINMRPFSERDAVAHIFTKDFGVLTGVMRGGVIAKKNRPLVGQYGAVSWNARLDSQLGVFHFESEKNLSAQIMMNGDLLKLMNAAFALIYTLIPEREAYTSLYNNTISFLQQLPESGSPYQDYLNWELGLLAELGYALDLTKCSGCQKNEDLYYLSPRTGRAVCEKCGEPYRDKLYKLPLNLNITERFLENICSIQGVEIPIARKMI